MFNFKRKKKWEPKGFLIDENMRMNDEVIKKFPNCMNSTKRFKKGTSDRLLIQWCKDTGWVVATRDIRMTILALGEGVPVLFVNRDYEVTKLIKPDFVDDSLYKDLRNFLVEREIE